MSAVRLVSTVEAPEQPHVSDRELARLYFPDAYHSVLRTCEDPSERAHVIGELAEAARSFLVQGIGPHSEWRKERGPF